MFHNKDNFPASSKGIGSPKFFIAFFNILVNTLNNFWQIFSNYFEKNFSQFCMRTSVPKYPVPNFLYTGCPWKKSFSFLKANFIEI